MARAMREIYGEALAKYGKDNDKVVVLDADLSSSSKTSKFAEVAPDRMFNVGIAEANMVAMGAGFASCGFIPFVNTFAALADAMCYLCTKAVIAYSNLNVRIVGNNNGLGGGYDGSTHHATDDLAVMRNVPGMLVMTPSDAVMADWMVKTLISDYKGPAYLSMERYGYDNIYDSGEKMEIGKAVRTKDGTDVVVFACGLSVYRALKAAEELEKEGISVSVYDFFTIKPFDKETVIEQGKKTGKIVTVEEHSIIGGLGSSVLEAVAEAGISAKIKRVGINDCFTQSGAYEELVTEYGVGTDSIAEAVRQILKGE